MCLEPVAERRSEHAGGGKRRATLHDEMLAIKEISRVPAVETKWLETGKRSEGGGRPFPPVAQHAVNAESALASRKSVHGHGVPAVKVKIAELVVGLVIGLGIGRLAAPRVRPCLSVDAAVGSTVPLRFRGERFACPARVGRCLGLTYIYRPVQRYGHCVERNLVEDGSV